MEIITTAFFWAAVFIVASIIVITFLVIANITFLFSKAAIQEFPRYQAAQKQKSIESKKIWQEYWAGRKHVKPVWRSIKDDYKKMKSEGLKSFRSKYPF